MNTWFISDTHFHHSNILRFTGDDGELIRPGFRDVGYMNNHMIEKWNSVVSKDDKVYHLGDVAMKTGTWSLDIMNELNGNKVLIRGNHDRCKLNVYSKHFKDVRSEIHLKSSENDMVIFTHRPILLPELKTACFNVHGHIHQNFISDFRYINVSVEVINYTPINWNDLNNLILERKKHRRIYELE